MARPNTSSEVTVVVSVAVEPTELGCDPAAPTKQKRQDRYRLRNTIERGVGQVNLIVPIDLRSEFQTIANRLRSGEAAMAEAVRMLASEFSSDTKLLAIPADRVQLVQRVLAAGNTGELATELGDGQAKLIGQTGKTSLDTWQLGELVKTMAVRMGSETLAMKVDTDEVEAATREIDDLLASRSPGGESASRSQNPLPAPRPRPPLRQGRQPWIRRRAR